MYIHYTAEAISRICYQPDIEISSFYADNNSTLNGMPFTCIVLRIKFSTNNADRLLKTCNKKVKIYDGVVNQNDLSQTLVAF